ncbi:dCTP deaminase [Candidatus Geothermarchaeota archaeon]|nr:MAG: dCTP deaminase [Candidatus Geothermarchaeota archaeon]
MILSDREILEAIDRGEIKIQPFNRENVGPCSVDLTLSSKFAVFTPGEVVDPRNPRTIKKALKQVNTRGKPLIISPGQFILATTKEKIYISKNLAATLEGKSSIARLGIVVHAAGLVNPGTGMKKMSTLTLEIFCMNTSPVKLYPGMKIVQIIFNRLSSAASVGYDERKTSKFIGQTSPIPVTL